jgi:hypothetical protein
MSCVLAFASNGTKENLSRSEVEGGTTSLLWAQLAVDPLEQCAIFLTLVRGAHGAPHHH